MQFIHHWYAGKHINFKVCQLTSRFTSLPIEESVRDEICVLKPQFPGHWILSHTIPVDYSVLSLSWNKEGKQLLVGGDALSLWSYSAEESVTSLLPPDPNSSGEGCQGVWGESWRCSLAQPAVYLSFSPDGAMFASASQDDHFVKIWYQSKIGMYMCCVYNTYVLTGIFSS